MLTQAPKETVRPLVIRENEKHTLALFVDGLVDFAHSEGALEHQSATLGEKVAALKRLASDPIYDGIKYRVEDASKWKDGNYSRFEAILASADIARATAYRHLRAWMKQQIAATVVPENVKAMVRIYKVLDLDKETTQNALKQAVFEAEGSTETPTQTMAVVTRACELAEAAEREQNKKELTPQERFIEMLQLAYNIAKEYNLPFSDVDAAVLELNRVWVSKAQETV